MDHLGSHLAGGGDLAAMDITVTRIGYNQRSSAFLSSGSSDFLNIILFVTASPCAAQVDPNISILCVRVLGPQTFATKACTGFWNTCVHVGVGVHWGQGDTCAKFGAKVRKKEKYS